MNLIHALTIIGFTCIIGLIRFINPIVVYSSNPCVHVTNSGETIKSFCSSEVLNPIQEAIDFAIVNNKTNLILDSGNFVISKPILNTDQVMNSPFNAGIGYYIPSGINLSGSKDPNNPTIISVDEKIPQIDVMVYVADHPTNLDSTLHDSSLSYLELNGTTNGMKKTVVGLWVGKANKNISLEHLNIHHLSTALIAGRFGQYNLDPQTGFGKIFPFSGTPTHYLKINSNLIHHFSGDGIAVMGGGYVEIGHNNVYEAGANTNGITGFVGVNNLWIHDNNISSTHVGIGLDGSFPILLLDVPQENIAALQDTVGIGNETGFGFSSLIHNNKITSAIDGIRLWRQHHANIVGNVISDSAGTAIHISESRDNYIGNNLINAAGVGVMLYSTGYSAVGTKYNGIGMYKNSDNSIINARNNFLNTTKGIVLAGNPTNMVSNNTIINNCFTNLQIDVSGGIQTTMGNNYQGNCDQLPLVSLTPLIPGDLDKSGSVDLLDYNLLASNFGNPYTLLDYNLIATNFGK